MMTWEELNTLDFLIITWFIEFKVSKRKFFLFKLVFVFKVHNHNMVFGLLKAHDVVGSWM